MLHVITVDSVLEKTKVEFVNTLKEHLGIIKGNVLHFYKERLAYFEWEKKRTFFVDPEYHSDEKAGSLLLDMIADMASRFDEGKAIKDLWSKSIRDPQLWIVDRLNEKTLRELRKMEQEGKIEYHCLMLYFGEPFMKKQKQEAYANLKRVTKASQNGRIGLQWINWTGKNSSAIVEKLVEQRYSEIQTLPRQTSGYENADIETPLSYIMRQYYSDMKDRIINWYPKKYVHKAMDEEKWGVEKLPAREQGKVKRHVLVTGTGRSGTTYFSDLLTLLGLDVGHQRNGNDGCSGAEFAVDHDWYPWFPVYGGGDCANVGERRSDYTYRHVLHIVRHPLWCIPSLMRNYPAINPEFWADNGAMDPKFMDASSIQRNAAMYYAINSTIDKSGQAEYRCQLEKIHDNWDTLMNVLEMKDTSDPSLKASNQASGWGQYEPLTWKQLEDEVGSTLSNSIRQMAKEYGYE